MEQNKINKQDLEELKKLFKDIEYLANSQYGYLKSLQEEQKISFTESLFSTYFNKTMHKIIIKLSEFTLFPTVDRLKKD